jgi:hypothetical protein
MTLDLPSVRVETGITVRGLVHSEQRVRGVRCGAERSFDAGSHAPPWLEAMGFVRPEESTIGVDTAYSKANYGRPNSYAGERLIFINGPAPTAERNLLRRWRDSDP